MPQENVGIRWVVPPETLAAAIEKYGDRVITAVTAVAGESASDGQNFAKSNAPWTDRTGNARTGLFGTAERDSASQTVTIFISHSPVIDYSVDLEIGHGGRYAIIMRSIESILPGLRSNLDQLLR